MAGEQGLAALLPGSQPVSRASERFAKTASECGALRVQMAGSWLMQLANHSTTTALERVYRKLPQDGIFNATPSNPVQIELGAFTVPASMVLLILDWRFDIYRPSGAIVGDVVPIEDRSLALQIGWDVVFAAKRPSNLEYEITPSRPTASKAAYTSNPNPGFIPDNGPIPLASQDQFARIRFLQTQEPAGPGASLLPQRHRRDVQPEMPFTYIVEATQRVQFLAIAIQPVPTPIAFFEAEFSGLLLGANAFKEFMEGANPCVGE
jgi:hypothetical protein